RFSVLRPHFTAGDAGAAMRRADARLLDIIFYHMTDRDMDRLVGWLSEGARGRFSDFFASSRRPGPGEGTAFPAKHWKCTEQKNPRPNWTGGRMMTVDALARAPNGGNSSFDKWQADYAAHGVATFPTSGQWSADIIGLDWSAAARSRAGLVMRRLSASCAAGE